MNQKMLKYYNSMVVFEEIPNEITLAINITNLNCNNDVFSLIDIEET